MNILHILSRHDSYDAIHTALDISRHLNKNNYNSIIASSLDKHILEGIDTGLQYRSIPRFETDIRNFFISYNILKEIIKANNTDIVHIHSMSGIWLAFLLCRNAKTRLLVSCYNFHPKNILSRGLILANRVIVHNEAVGRHLISNFSLSKEKIQFISPGIDIDNFKFQGIDERSKTDFTIGVVPSFLSESGYEYFLKAMVKVVRAIPYINICILIFPSHSRKNIKEDLEFWTRRLGLSSYVKFFDASNLDLKLLKKFNLLIYTPITENALARIILEAQAYGVPVITEQVVGVTRLIVDGITGVLIPPKDSASLANAVTKILKEFAFARELVLGARKRTEEKFSIDKNINGFINTYKELKNKRNILVVNLGNANKVTSAIPALNLLRKNMPDCTITTLVSPHLRCLLQRCPYINDLLVFDSQNKRLFGFLGIIRSIIEKRFDTVFDFSNTFRSQFISCLSLASNRYGYRNRFFNFFINNHIERPTPSNESIKDRLSILDLAGINTRDYTLELWPSREDMEFIDEFFRDNWIGKERVVSIDISHKGRFLKNKKMVEYLVYLCNSLTKEHTRVVLIGSKESLKIKNELFKRINPKSVAFISDISCTQLACLMKRCQLYISFHYDFIYIAITVKVPSLIISLDKDITKFSQLKNVATLKTEDFSLSNKRIYRKRQGVVTEKDIVMQTIDRMMQVK